MVVAPNRVMIRPSTEGLLQSTFGRVATPLTAPVNATVALAGGRLAEGAGAIEAAAELRTVLPGVGARPWVGVAVPEHPTAVSATSAAARSELTWRCTVASPELFREQSGLAYAPHVAGTGRTSTNRNGGTHSEA